MPRAARRRTVGNGSLGPFCRPSVRSTTPRTGAASAALSVPLPLSASASAGCQSVVCAAGSSGRAGCFSASARPASVAGAVSRSNVKALVGMSRASRAMGAPFASISRRATSRRGSDSTASPGLSPSSRASRAAPRPAGRGSAVAMLSETSTATITRPLTTVVKGLGRDRLEQGEHQHRRRGQPKPEQAEPSPPRDEPPLLAIEDHEQHQGEHAGRDPEPAQPAPRQQQPPPSEQVERHGDTSVRPDLVWWTAHLGPCRADYPWAAYRPAFWNQPMMSWSVTSLNVSAMAL